jgi:hypothetical protein
VTVAGGALRAVMPNMLEHRRAEAAYYRALLGELAAAAGLALSLTDNPHRWEGMADVAVVGDQVVLTYAVPGHYDRDTTPKSSRSSRAGVAFAADAAGVPEDARIYAELVYPHFHGDTVHFGARPAQAPPVLVHHRGGLYGDGADTVAARLGADRIVAIAPHDAVEQYAGNSVRTVWKSRRRTGLRHALPAPDARAARAAAAALHRDPRRRARAPRANSRDITSQ